MVLGIGRGDSALAYVGLAPASPTTLFRFVEALQIYLRGEGVPFDLLPDSNIARMDSLGLAESPEYSELKWLQLDVPKVPVEVSASGPKVIAGAAILADTLNLAVGADPNRVRWGIELAKTSRGQAGLPADGLSYGAWINVVVSDDPNEARRIGGGRLAGAIRFGAMHGTANGPVSDSDRKVIESVPRAYAMSHHGESGTNADQQIPDEFAHKFGVFGPANYCVERLLELKELGLDSFVLIPPGADTDPDGVQLRIIADEVVSRF
jgi:5,10-methylenetetrahydromethanopterin reductase